MFRFPTGKKKREKSQCEDPGRLQPDGQQESRKHQHPQNEKKKKTCKLNTHPTNNSNPQNGVAIVSLKPLSNVTSLVPLTIQNPLEL
jgi:hypothetical protein